MSVQMELITWYDKYSVNNEDFDNDHKKLFDLIDVLYESCMIKDKAVPLASDLLFYSTLHISKEEEYMRSIGYKEIHEHMYENGIFTRKVVELLQAINEQNSELTKELIKYLAYWLLNHVMVDDKKFSI